MQEKNKIIC